MFGIFVYIPGSNNPPPWNHSLSTYIKLSEKLVVRKNSCP